MRPFHRWTQADLDEVEERRLRGESLAEIAAAMSMTRAQVKHAAEYHGLCRTCRREERWLRLLRSGMRDAEIASMMGVKIGTVAQTRLRLRRLRSFRSIPAGIHHLTGLPRGSARMKGKEPDHATT